MFAVRIADQDDSDQIVLMLKGSFRSELLQYTMFGCPGVEHYIRDAIRLHDFGGHSLYLVCVKHDRLVGVAEFRRGFDSLFLNHICVLPAEQSKGVGHKLLLEGLIFARDFEQQDLELDVFLDNRLAKEWYGSLGLEAQSQTVWVELPIPSVEAVAPCWWSILDMPQADRVQQAYGFSQFRLQTGVATHAVGRLGRSLFRATTREILRDASAMSALHTLDPHRRLLCIAPLADASDDLANKETTIACSERLKGSIEIILRSLSERMSRPI